MEPSVERWEKQLSICPSMPHSFYFTDYVSSTQAQLRHPYSKDHSILALAAISLCFDKTTTHYRLTASLLAINRRTLLPENTVVVTTCREPGIHRGGLDALTGAGCFRC